MSQASVIHAAGRKGPSNNFSNLLAVVVGLSRGTVLSSAVETTPTVAAFLTGRGEPLGGVALGDPLIAGWDWGVAKGVVFAPVV